MKANNEELFIVVNENDQILDYLPRLECHKQNILHRSVGIILINDQDQILLQKRSKKKDIWPGFYTVSASGHVSKGESYKKAAQRELSEELGINTTLKLIRKVINNDPTHLQMQTFYVTKSNGPFKIQTKEVDDVKFFTLGQIQKILLETTPTVKLALALLNLL